MNTNESHPCPNCGKQTPNEREELLGIPHCIDCAPQPDISLAGIIPEADLKDFVDDYQVDPED